MFAWWGRTVYRFRYIVIGVMVALCLGGGVFGISLGAHVTQSGFYDEGSQSVHASLVADAAYGRDTSGHIIAIYTAPEGKTVDDPAFQKKVLDNLAKVEKDHPDSILRTIGYFKSPELLKNMADDDKKHAFMSVQLKGDNDDAILNNYNKNLGEDGTTVKEALNIPGLEVQQAGLQPLASELTGTIGEDQKRAEVAAIPLVCVVLFFVFGGVVAAALPGIIGGLTIAGALGVMRLVAEFAPVHFFAQPVVTLMGLGIAVDYGLFMVSRFREELAEGYDTEAAVRRTVMTSGRTVMFSAVILVASSVPLLLFPQGFLKSITYAIIASVMLAAILSITVLAAALAILGPRVDALGVRTLIKFALPDPIESDPANQKTNTFAIASIPLGLLLPPVGIALGHIARKRIKQTGEQGANLALIGLILGYVALYGAMAYGVIAMRDTGVIGSAVYWMLLGIIIFLVVVTAGLALARAVPLARGPIVWWLNWLAEKTQKTKTRAEVEKGFWGKLVNRVMKRPIAFAAPIVIFMIILIIPLGQLALGGISEKYLPPDNSVRQAQEQFDKTFPGFRTEPLTLVIESDNGEPVTDQQIAEIRAKAMAIPGFIETNNDPASMWKERSYLDGASKDPSVRVIQNGLVVRNDASEKIDELRAIPPPRGVTVSVGGTPALEQDSIHSLFDKLPLMVLLLITTTTILMFLAFGSIVLPIKAALMSALTLGSTMGVLTWMFVEGHGSGPDELHAAAPDGADDRPDHRRDLGSVDRLRGVPGLSHGGGARARHVHRRGDPHRYGHHRPVDHRCRHRPCRRRGRVRVLRPGDDEVPGLRPAPRAAARRHDHPNVPGAGDHEAPRRRLLVGAAVDEAHPGATRPRRDRTARRAQAAHRPRVRERSRGVGRCGSPGSHPAAARPRPPRRRHTSARPRPARAVPPARPARPGPRRSRRASASRLRRAPPASRHPRLPPGRLRRRASPRRRSRSTMQRRPPSARRVSTRHRPPAPAPTPPPAPQPGRGTAERARARQHQPRDRVLAR